VNRRVSRRCRIIILPEFERDVQRLRKRFPSVHASYEEALGILETDPFNLEKGANISKLVGVRPGEGQFRLPLGDWRLRYDVVGDEVVLHSMRPRSESYRP
jgi:addiction module RelE/StbE family toxin